MISQMQEFTTFFLTSIATFLGSEPIVYLFALFCLVVIIRAVKIIL